MAQAERKYDLASMTLPELTEYIVALGEPKYRAKQIFDWINKGENFSGMKNVKWKKSVRPGDTFVTECSVVRKVGAFCFVKGVGYVGDDVVLEAEFSFALVPAETKEA